MVTMEGVLRRSSAIARVTVCTMGQPLIAKLSYDSHRAREPNRANADAKPAQASSFSGS